MNPDIAPETDPFQPGDTPFIGISVDVNAKYSRWSCEGRVPRELEGKSAMADKAVRAFGPWQCGDYYRPANGRFRMPLIWIGEGEPIAFNPEEFAKFAQAVGHFASTRSIHQHEPSESNQLKLARACAELGQRDWDAVESLIEALIEVDAPFLIEAGLEGGPIRFVAGTLPRSATALFDSRVKVAKRTDVVLVCTATGQKFLVADPASIRQFKIGDSVRFRNAGPIEQLRCIRVSAVVVEGDGSDSPLLPVC